VAGNALTESINLLTTHSVCKYHVSLKNTSTAWFNYTTKFTSWQW